MPDELGANRTAFGDDGGDDGAIFEGLTSTMTGRTYCLPRETAIVPVLVGCPSSWWMTNAGDDLSM